MVHDCLYSLVVVPRVQGVGVGAGLHCREDCRWKNTMEILVILNFAYFGFGKNWGPGTIGIPWHSLWRESGTVCVGVYVWCVYVWVCVCGCVCVDGWKACHYLCVCCAHIHDHSWWYSLIPRVTKLISDIGLISNATFFRMRITLIACNFVCMHFATVRSLWSVILHLKLGCYHVTMLYNRTDSLEKWWRANCIRLVAMGYRLLHSGLVLVPIQSVCIKVSLREIAPPTSLIVIPVHKKSTT